MCLTDDILFYFIKEFLLKDDNGSISHDGKGKIFKENTYY